jgi:hypothetical protein
LVFCPGFWFSLPSLGVSFLLPTLGFLVKIVLLGKIGSFEQNWFLGQMDFLKEMGFLTKWVFWGKWVI